MRSTSKVLGIKRCIPALYSSATNRNLTLSNLTLFFQHREKFKIQNKLSWSMLLHTNNSIYIRSSKCYSFKSVDLVVIQSLATNWTNYENPKSIKAN